MSVTVNDKNLGHATAYAYAKSKGYTGTEEEFAELMASYATVAEAAAESAEQAASSASAASGSASTANTAAQTATTKASEAAQSATNAQQSATNASSSASAASTSASNANTSAQTATTKANEASQSASNAASSATTANTAKNDAVTAKNDAVTAKDDAVTAKTAAETAKTEAEAAATEATQIVGNKADKDGSYPDLSVGEVFSDDSYTEDQTPYLYRVSGGGVEVGKVEADKIVGGTVAWNQLVQNGNFETDTIWTNESGTTHTVANGVITINTTVNNNGIRQNGVSCIKDHKYLLSYEAKHDTPVRIGVGLTSASGLNIDPTVSNTWARYASIRNCTTTLESNAFYIFGRNTTLTNAQVRNVMFIDLTQMFGTTIADYIYTLETATAGAGVAWFKKLFPKPYYPYNAGELLSVSGLQSHDMVGFNQWDEEWEVGSYNPQTGDKSILTTAIRSKNFIRALPGTKYYAPSTVYYVFCYDDDKNYLGIATYTATTGGYIWETLDKTAYITFRTEVSYGAIYKNDICINLSWDGQRNGEYEPYEVHSYPLDSSLTLRGIPKLDSANNLYYDGDNYESDGKVTRKYGIVDLGTLTWTYRSSDGYIYTNGINTLAKGASTGTVIANAVCSKYPVVGRTNQADKTLSINDAGVVGVFDSSYTDAATFKTAMSGVMLVYELATPTEETAEPYTEYQKVSKYGTEEYVSTGIVPVGHVTKYPTDIVSKVDGLPSDFSTLIAPTEKGFTATRAYTVNELLIVNNTLYKVTANIANGATITVGTNVQQTTLSALIKALSA